MPSFIVAAPASGSGKTVITAGIIAALRRNGVPVRAAKAGPDFIDPAFLTAAAGDPAINLDLWAMRPSLIEQLAAGDNLVVEGVMGLFDGPTVGEGSTADLAKRLQLPVVFVVSAERQSHSVAALIHGFNTFDPAVRLAGVIFTRVGSARHEMMLRQALERTGVPCFGAMPYDSALDVASRHLGLVQAQEHADLPQRMARIADVIEDTVDLAALTALHAPSRAAASAAPLPPLGQTIAVASDAAFSFAYPHLLAGWRAAGAAIVPFSPLAGEAPAQDADAVFLPGGYPELFAGALAGADAWQSGLRERASAGALIYGECGGYMALGEQLIDADGESHAMAGLLPVTTTFEMRKRTLGYRTLTAASPLVPPHLRGHEFHYAQEVDRRGPPLFQAFDPAGRALGDVGAIKGRVAGSFMHVIDLDDRSHPFPKG